MRSSCATATATTTFLGIDVAKATLEAALIEPTGGSLRRKRFANDPDGFAALLEWLAPASPAQVHACLEATGIYSDALARFLHEAGAFVSVVNPARTKAFAASRLTRNKTDRADARLLAQFCQSQQPGRWVPREAAQEELQALTRHLESLLLAQQQHQNRLEAERSETVRLSLEGLVAYLGREIECVKRRVQEHIAAQESLRSAQALLCSIPGIAALTAAKLLGEMPHLASFGDVRQAAAYAGLTPRQKQSGTSVRGRTALSKTGNARVRKALYMPALVAMRYNPVVKALCTRLRDRHKSPMVIVGAAMRKLLHLAYGVLKTQRPFDPKFG